jgi:hypothetical protein
MNFKNILLWTIYGALFGVAFGATAAFFENGPSVMTGIQQSWWWFAIAGFMKGVSDSRIKPSKV